MEDQLFDKKTIQTLEDNGYSFKKKENFISFRHSAMDQTGLGVLGIFLFLTSFLLLSFGTVIWLASVFFLIAGLIVARKRMAGRSVLMFDLRDRSFFHKTKNRQSKWFPLEEISEIILKSKFVSEYTSALKSTSEEHQITISLKLQSDQVIEIFRFLSDYSEPSIQIKNVYNWLESTARSGRSGKN